MVSPSTPSRRERPAKPALTRAGIVATAVAVMRAEGVERVTMRRLAQELDTGPASLYVYVEDTEELHAAVLDELLAEVDLGGAGPWRERLWSVLDSYRHVLFDHPSLARVALVSRLTGPHYLALVETVLALLDESGMAPGQAAWAVDVLLLVATATAVEHGTRQETRGAGRDHDRLAATLAGLPATTHPRIAAHGADLVSGPGPARARWAFEVLLNGALTTARPPTGETP
jgi:AcrR family transcriptional regulator